MDWFDPPGQRVDREGGGETRGLGWSGLAMGHGQLPLCPMDLSASPGTATTQRSRDPGWGAAPFPASTREPLLESNLFSFTRYSSWKRKRAVGDHKSSSSLWLFSRVMSPKAPEAGLRLCEQPPRLQAVCPRLLKGGLPRRETWGLSQFKQPTPTTHLRLSSSCRGWGWAPEHWQGTDMYLTRPHPQLHLEIKSFLTVSCAVSFQGRSPMLGQLKILSST